MSDPKKVNADVTNINADAETVFTPTGSSSDEYSRFNSFRLSPIDKTVLSSNQGETHHSRLDHSIARDNKTQFMGTEEISTISNPTEEIFSGRVSIHKGEHDLTLVNAIDENRGGKSTSDFGISDIDKKLDAEMLEIPEDYSEDIDQSQMSMLMKSQDKATDEQLKLNRHFLLDAAPFTLERLVDELKQIPSGLRTGFQGLDQYLTIPADALTIIASRPQHGKTSFMLNTMLNICRIYPDKHILYYTYEEPKREIILRLINMCSVKPFMPMPGIFSNLQRWKHEFSHVSIEELQERAQTDSEYFGLKDYLELSNRIHVVDSNYPCHGLIKSIQSFKQAFPLAAVFIDSLPKIRLEENTELLALPQQFKDIANTLKNHAHEFHLPIIISAPFMRGPKGTPEYDLLSEEYLVDVGGPDQIANLVIGIQNYARSAYIGSNLGGSFKSSFFDQPLSKAELMPENLKDLMNKTIFLAKVLVNVDGLEPETELLFHKQLLKLTDFSRQF